MKMKRLELRQHRPNCAGSGERIDAEAFVLSDHADWSGLVQAIRATGAQRILVTHGYTRDLSRWLCRQGFDSRPLEEKRSQRF